MGNPMLEVMGINLMQYGLGQPVGIYKFTWKGMLQVVYCKVKVCIYESI